MEIDVEALGALLERVRQRDAAAAEELVDFLFPIVMIVIQRRLPPGADPRDLAQEVLVKVLNGLDSFRGQAASLLAWSRRIAFRTCLNEWRRRRSRPECTWSDLSPEQQLALASAAHPQTEGESSQTAARDTVRWLLQQLPAEDRFVLELVDLEERPLAEVQELTGWSALNIRVRRFRARRRLSTLLTSLEYSRKESLP